MPTPQELTAALATLNTATSGLGAADDALATAFDALSTRVFALTTKISTRMTDADVAAVKAALDAETNRIDNGVVALRAIADAANAMAVTPADPVPEPVPPPVTELPTTPVA